MMKIRLFFFVLLMSGFFISNSQCADLNLDNRKNMIIVVSNEFSPLLTPFIDAKQKDNIDCIIIKIDSGENFNHIKSKIDNSYNQHSADYLLLIGDFEYIPSYIVEEGLSDVYYTFESIDNPIPRMAVGRFSVENEQDLRTMIERSIARKPFSGHVVGIASQGVSELTHQSDYEQIRLMNELLLEKGFTNISELFDGSQGGADTDGNPAYSDVLKILNKGASWLNYAGYGSYNGWNTSGFEIMHIDSLHDGIELPILVSSSCLGGHFAGRTCFAEKWLRSSRNGNPIGAVAVIMSSSLADWDATLSAMLTIARNMPTLNENCRLGDMYLQAYSHIVNEMHRPKEANCWLLFGDPSLWIYPSPNANTINHLSMSPSPEIYPNPARNSIIIDKINTDIETIYQLVDTQGKVIKQGKLKEEKSLIDISNVSDGIYFFRLINEKQVYSVRKIVKQSKN